jgi:hypothetical protein
MNMRANFWMVISGCLAALAGGCTTSQSLQTRTPLVQTPNGGQISLLVIQQVGNDLPGTGPLAVWKTADGQQKVLTTLVPAPGSPGGGVVRIQSSSPHFSSDGNRCWLERDGKAVASFDYISGVAILGPAGQPDWAKPE